MSSEQNKTVTVNKYNITLRSGRIIEAFSKRDFSGFYFFMFKMLDSEGGIVTFRTDAYSAAVGSNPTTMLIGSSTDILVIEAVGTIEVLV